MEFEQIVYKKSIYNHLCDVTEQLTSYQQL